MIMVCSALNDIWPLNVSDAVVSALCDSSSDVVVVLPSIYSETNFLIHA